MKKIIYSTFLLIAVQMMSYAQEKLELKVKFGQISDAEIKMKSYEKDPEAPAVILFDKGSLSLKNKVVFEVHKRIKIFKKDAYDEANIEILYNPKSQRVSGLKAVAYNFENNQLVETKAGDANIFDEKLNKSRTLKKIIIPGVKEGSIIELKYTIEDAYLQNWEFQNEIPTIWSEYEMELPIYYIFEKIGQGTTPYALNEYATKNGSTIGHWIQKDVPAIKPEKYMSSIDDYRTKLSFYLEEIRPPYGTTIPFVEPWDKTAEELMNHDDFGFFIKRKGAFKDELAQIVNDNMSPLEKTQAIYNYVGSTFETSKIAYSLDITEEIKDLKKSKKTTASEQNLFFLNMLHMLDISASPVLIRTRDEGHIGTPLAVLSRYNRVICKVKIAQDTFFVDPSGYPQPMKLIPFEDLSGYGIELLGKNKYAFVNPQSKITDKYFVQVNASLDGEGGLVNDISIVNRGYDGFRSKKAIKDNGIDKFLKDLLKEAITDGKLESQSFENATNLSDETLKGKIKVTTNAFSTKSNDKIYINPMLCFGTTENFFKEDKRLYDIDYGNMQENTYIMTLKIPDGYKIESLPKTFRTTTEDGGMRFDYIIDSQGNTIKVNTKMITKKTVFAVDEYMSIRDLYSKMLAKEAEQIVLTKI